MRIISALLLTILCVGCGGYGSSSSNNAAPQPGIVPAIAELSPDNADSGNPGFTLTVNGSSFNTNAVVKWNGTNQTTTYLTANQLTVAIPASAIVTPGAIPVSVTNPGTPASTGGPYGSTGGTRSETSNVMNFTVK
jgi:hypothetical protein